MRRILLYGHPLCIDHLDRGPFGEVEAWVEVAEQSIVAFRSPADPGPGAEAFLTASGRPRSVEVNGSILFLASDQPVPAEAVSAGAVLTEPSVGWLLHVQHVPRFRDLLSHADGIALWWDLADPPGASFEALAELLAVEARRGVWKGVHLYTHPERPLEDADARRAHWSGWLEAQSALEAS